MGNCGTPDWRAADEYGDTTAWRRDRWRWEFLWRRQDVREEFQRLCDEAHRQSVEDFKDEPEFFRKPLEIDQPGFAVRNSKVAREIRLPRLPNPAIGDQPYWVIADTDPDGGVRQITSEFEPDGYLRVDFDLSKPLEVQLADARALALEMQVEQNGQRLQKREQTTKWLLYLRVLDARESGASWSVIARERIGPEATPQRARDTHKQAERLYFSL